MNILLIGSGGREHALAWASPPARFCDKLFARPAIPASDQVARNGCAQDHRPCRRHRLLPRQKRSASSWSVRKRRWWPGWSDDLAAAGIKAFGPTKSAAQLEGSKGFTKDICAEHGIPTAAYGRFTETGSGARLSRDPRRAHRHQGRRSGRRQGRDRGDDNGGQPAPPSTDIFAGRFGGAECVIEEFLEGEEASFFVLTDGKNALPLATAQDHKRVGDGDTGPNTGGMGAYSPAPCMTPALCDEALERSSSRRSARWPTWAIPTWACSTPG